MYKKVYIEITNICNLNCSFCIKNGRPTKYMTTIEFENILSKLKGHTKYLYFHVLGEPLMHPKINEFINLAATDYKINITTNGYLINKIKNNKNIRQLNISLHSYNEINGVSIEEYMENIFKTIDILKKNTYISLRFWLKNKSTNKIIKLINSHYNTNINYDDIKNNSTLVENIFLSINDEFTWPDINLPRKFETGTCYALKDHIGILVDGTIVPCCLDSKGTIKLGNIFLNDITDIIKSKRYINMLNGFNNGQRIEELCKTCNFLCKK